MKEVARQLKDWRTYLLAIVLCALVVGALSLWENRAARQDAVQSLSEALDAQAATRETATRRIDTLTARIDTLVDEVDEANDTIARLEQQVSDLREQVFQLGGQPVVVVPEEPES